MGGNTDMEIAVAALPPPHRRTSGLAIAAFVVSLVAPVLAPLVVLRFFSSAVSGARSGTLAQDMEPLIIVLSADLLLGIIALGWTVARRKRVAGMGLATAGVLISVFGLVVVVPFLHGLRDEARKMTCMMNIQQLGLAVRMYSQDHDGRLPLANDWCDPIASEYTKSRGIFVCPEAPGLRSGYALNQALAGTAAHPGPRASQEEWDRQVKELHLDQTVVLYESDLGWNGAGGPDTLVAKPRHRGLDVFFMADGHTRAMYKTRESELIWQSPQ